MTLKNKVNTRIESSRPEVFCWRLIVRAANNTDVLCDPVKLSRAVFFFFACPFSTILAYHLAIPLPCVQRIQDA